MISSEHGWAAHRAWYRPSALLATFAVITAPRYQSDFAACRGSELEVAQRVRRSIDVNVPVLPARPQGEAPRRCHCWSPCATRTPSRRQRRPSRPPSRHHAPNYAVTLAVISKSIRTRKSRPIRWRSFSGQCWECPRNRRHAGQLGRSGRRHPVTGVLEQEPTMPFDRGP